MITLSALLGATPRESVSRALSCQQVSSHRAPLCLLSSFRHSMRQVRVSICRSAADQLTPQLLAKSALLQPAGCQPSRMSSSKRPRTGSRHQIRAKGVSNEEAAAGEWAALLKEEGDDTDTTEDTIENLNKLCNKGVRLMLSGRIRDLDVYKDELSDVGRHFTEQSDMPGALFIYALYKMTEHVIVKETEQLEGIYLTAFKKVFCLLEDSGWRLVREGEEDDEDVSLDDLPLMGYMQ